MRREKVWGYEKWIVNSPLYCGKILYLNKDYRCSLHCHKIKTETFYIMKGLVRMEITKEIIMEPGDSITILPGTHHRFTGITDAVILEVSTKHFEDDSYRKTKSEYIGGKNVRQE